MNVVRVCFCLAALFGSAASAKAVIIRGRVVDLPGRTLPNIGDLKIQAISFRGEVLREGRPDRLDSATGEYAIEINDAYLAQLKNLKVTLIYSATTRFTTTLTNVSAVADMNINVALPEVNPGGVSSPPRTRFGAFYNPTYVGTGIQVARVSPGWPASRVRVLRGRKTGELEAMMPGDTIEFANGQPIASEGDLRAAIDSVEPEGLLYIVGRDFRNGGQPYTAFVALP